MKRRDRDRLALTTRAVSPIHHGSIDETIERRHYAQKDGQGRST